MPISKKEILLNTDEEIVYLIMDTESNSKDYVEILDLVKCPFVYDEHTGTLDIAISDIQRVIDLLETVKELVSQEYMMRGIM